MEIQRKKKVKEHASSRIEVPKIQWFVGIYTNLASNQKIACQLRVNQKYENKRQKTLDFEV